LLNNYNASNDDNAELIRLAAIKYLNASRLHTLEIGEICFCEHIEILNLSGNYIKRIEALAQCVHLSRLDLSDNQISQLPDVKFWLSFSKLKVLYLHSNTITKIDNVRRVSACPVLEILTLHDTPLSLKKNYRHHVINTIYTLKALDHFVVSDEEIIEDAKYNNKFSGRSQAFRINMHLKPTPGNTYSDEVKATSLLMAAINKIQAHHSPVIIIQKFIRGSIDRKYAKMYRDAMLWSAIKIQKWWRKKKNLKYIPAEVQLKKTPTTLSMQMNKNLFISKSFRTDETSSFFSFSQDEYRKHYAPNTPVSTSLGTVKKNITIDLMKLHNRSSSMINDSSIMMHNEMTLASGRYFDDRSKSEMSLLQRSYESVHIKTATRRHRRENNKFFELGALLTHLKETCELDFGTNKTLAARGIDALLKLESNRVKMRRKALKEASLNEQFDGVDYRLPLNAKKIAINDLNTYVANLINEKKFYRNAINETENEIHKKMFTMRENVEIVDKQPFKTNDQRLFQKIYGTLALGCLRAVDKAYHDRNNAEKLLHKIEMIKKINDDKEYIQRQVDFYQEEKLRSVQKARDKDRLQIAVAKRRIDLQPLQTRDKVQEKRLQERAINMERHKDIEFTSEFNKQHLSVSKALQKHESNVKREEVLKSKTSFIERQRAELESQHKIVRKYMQQRNYLRIAEQNTERQIINAKVANGAQSRLLSARQRVSRIRVTNTTFSRTQPSNSKMNQSNGRDKSASSVSAPNSAKRSSARSNMEQLKVTIIDSSIIPRDASAKTLAKRYTPLTESDVYVNKDD